ncbi:MAG: TonB-dependent receptor [Pseudomonadales bacterium]|nr:TonB-dependent receptor [Pseudomonadales bacterium]MCP5330518.1 TonB-dependent receptor [Pseudomonadales bacterium]
MQHRKLFTSIAALGAGTAIVGLPVAQAQEPAALEELIVTSSRIETPLRQIGTSVSVLNAEDIAAEGSASLMDVLRTLPSISVTNTGGSGQVSNLRIRGEEGYRTLTLIDGIRLSDPSVTQVQGQPEHLLSSGIERVEILRGPQGLHYGADAGGVLNLSTRKATQVLDTRLDASSGAFGTQQWAGNISAGNERADFFFSGAHFETEGFNARVSDTLLADDDGYDNTTVHTRVGLNVSENLRVELVHRDTAGDSEYDGCYDTISFSTVHDCDARFDQQASRLSASLDTSAGLQSLAWTSTRTEREYFSSGVSGFASAGELQRVEYLGQWLPSERWQLVYGVDYEEEDNNGDSREQWGYYAEVLSDFSDNLYLSAGIRRDENDDFGKHNSVRLSAARLFALAQGTLKLRSSYGTGFRAPSPYESSYNKGPFASAPASTTALKEERSRGVEAAVEYYTPGALHLEAVYFDQRIEDAITFDMSSYSGYLQDNGESRSRGLELSATLPFGTHWEAQLNYTHNRAERPDGTPRQLRPRHLGNVKLGWHSADERLRLNAYYRLSRDTVDISGGQTVSVADSRLTDITASFAVMPDAELYGRIDNLFDADYEEVYGYHTAGRAAYVGVRLHF